MGRDDRNSRDFADMLDRLVKAAAPAIYTKSTLDEMRETDITEDVLGTIMAAMFFWDGSAITRTAVHALRAANFSTVATQLEEMFEAFITETTVDEFPMEGDEGHE